jgi:hypothetical protein
MKEAEFARFRSTHGGQPKPQHVIMSGGIFKTFEDGPDGVAPVSRSSRDNREAVPAPRECPTSTKAKPCHIAFS